MSRKTVTSFSSLRPSAISLASAWPYRIPYSSSTMMFVFCGRSLNTVCQRAEVTFAAYSISTCNGS